MLQIQKDEKIKSIGLVKLNLAEFVSTSDKPDLAQSLGSKKRKMLWEKCYDKEASITFELNATPIAGSAAGDGETMTMISDAMSIDSGPDSEFDFGDMDENKSRGGSVVKKPRKASVRRIKAADPDRPPLPIGKAIPGTTNFDPSKIIKSKPLLPIIKQV